MKKSLTWFRALNLTALFIAATSALADDPLDPLLDPAYLLWLLGRIGIPGG